MTLEKKSFILGVLHVKIFLKMLYNGFLPLLNHYIFGVWRFRAEFAPFQVPKFVRNCPVLLYYAITHPRLCILFLKQ